MRFLIDAAALALTAPRWVASWWAEVLPAVFQNLEGHDIFVLLRETPPFGALDAGIEWLVAPPADRQDWAREDRRLSLLVDELGIDCFVSTLTTSAGGRRRTLLVSPPRRLWTENPHRRIAFQLASGFLVFSTSERRNPKGIWNIEQDWVKHARSRRLKGSRRESLDVSQEIARAMVATAEHTTWGAALERRKKAEHEVSRIAEACRHRSEVRLASSYEREGQKRWIHVFFGRLYRAVADPLGTARKVVRYTVSSGGPQQT